MCAAKRLFQACVSIQSRSDIDGVRMLKDSYIRNKVEENLDHCYCLLQMFKNKKNNKKKLDGLHKESRTRVNNK